MKIDSWNDHPTNMFWNYYNEWYQDPWRLGLYAQDKLEFEGMVVNLGLRFDLSRPIRNGMTTIPMMNYSIR
ncbi:MAG: hypothetical protein U5N26_11205 [Candidatus Marinimicrobia bacterium]|nr:hypothetical protein [Candidatus Neomarinimicrobiota bacterium]